MRDQRPENGLFSTPAARTGAAALGLAAGLAAFAPGLSIIPLAGYLIACLVSPFRPCTNFFLPVICRGDPQKKGVVLTFDDGPDPATTPALLDLLKRRNAVATFFVTGRRALDHPDLIRQIKDQGHGIGNHSFGHDTLVMFKGKRRIQEEIAGAQAALAILGVSASAFRPPAGITYPGLGPALEKYGLVAVNYSLRAMDRGNRSFDGLARKILARLAPGDIIMLHDLAPPDPARTTAWLHEIETLLQGIESREIRIRPLTEILESPSFPGAPE